MAELTKESVNLRSLPRGGFRARVYTDAVIDYAAGLRREGLTWRAITRRAENQFKRGFRCTTLSENVKRVYPELTQGPGKPQEPGRENPDQPKAGPRLSCEREGAAMVVKAKTKTKEAKLHVYITCWYGVDDKDETPNVISIRRPYLIRIVDCPQPGIDYQYFTKCLSCEHFGGRIIESREKGSKQT